MLNSQALLKNIHQISFGVAGTKRKCRHYDVEENGAGSGQNPGTCRSLGGRGDERENIRQFSWPAPAMMTFSHERNILERNEKKQTKKTQFRI